ncbi:MAG: dephospho-CoA kinase [Succinivibrio sp.]|nr:dephospho-CoA kinase [Succinivibrio sp.]
MSLKVALTGGIACGKSVITEAFLKLEVKVIDTDLISREVVAPGTALLSRLAAVFSEQILTPDKCLDRKMLRSLVFNDPIKLKTLNALLHPAILASVKEKMADYAAEPYVVVAVPLLFELNWQEHFDRILVADCEEEVQLQRLEKRDGISRELALKMLSAQVSRATRRSLAQDLIETDKLTLQEISNYVLKLDTVYRNLAKNLTDTNV